MTNHMQNISSFRETHRIFSSSPSKRSFWIHTVNVAGSGGKGRLLFPLAFLILKWWKNMHLLFPVEGEII